jgi:hypothetical protein
MRKGQGMGIGIVHGLGEQAERGWLLSRVEEAGEAADLGEEQVSAAPGGNPRLNARHEAVNSG